MDKKKNGITPYFHYLNLNFFLFIVSGDGISHSLSWHRKGDRMSSGRLYARVWTPDDPRSIQRSLSMIASLPTGSHTGL